MDFSEQNRKVDQSKNLLSIIDEVEGFVAIFAVNNIPQVLVWLLRFLFHQLILIPIFVWIAIDTGQVQVWSMFLVIL